MKNRMQSFVNRGNNLIEKGKKQRQLSKCSFRGSTIIPKEL